MVRDRGSLWARRYNRRQQRHGAPPTRQVINPRPRLTVAAAQINLGDNQRKLPINGVSQLSNRHNKRAGQQDTSNRQLQPLQEPMRRGSNKDKGLPRQIGRWCAPARVLRAWVLCASKRAKSLGVFMRYANMLAA